MQTIIFHRGGFCFAKFISGWLKSLRIHTRINLHRKKGGDRVLRQIRTMLCADFVDHREHSLRIRIAVWQEEKRLHQFRDRGVFVVAFNNLQTGHGRPECIDAIFMARRSASVATAYLLLNLRSPRDCLSCRLPSCRRRPFAPVVHVLDRKLLERKMSPSPKSQVMFASAFS